jgi:hypothetical protein
MDERATDLANAWLSMRKSFEPDSNVTVRSALDAVNHFAGRTVREAGMQMNDSNGHSERKERPKDASCEPASNATEKSERQVSKGRAPICWREEERVSTGSEEQPQNALVSIDLSLEPGSKVID